MRNATPLVVFLFVASTLNAQKITTFDVPNGIDTTPTAISPSGQIVGYYEDAKTLELRGFIRNTDGTITSFDCPGPGTVSFCALTGIGPSGQIVGYEYPVQVGYEDYGIQSFQRNRDGTISSFGTSFNAGEGSGLIAGAINPSGEIVGTWDDVEEVSHGFLRAPDGTITTFDIDPHRFSPGTLVTAVNPAGMIVGWGNDFDIFDSRLHGFVRQVDGTITTFDALNATSTFPLAINARGQVAGLWIDSTGHNHGFVREVDGSITIVDFPSAMDTALRGIDSRGQVAGDYRLADNSSQPFVSDRNGHFTTIEVPDSAYTTVAAMNPGGDIVGTFDDAKGVHGWVRMR